MELMARVKAQLRRYEQIISLKTKEDRDDSRLIVGDLELDLYAHEVRVNGKTTRLTKKEFDILKLLMESPGRIYSAEDIYENVWQEAAVNTETVVVHVRKLREKIEVNPRKPEYLKVVWGIGYKIEKM